MHQMQHCDVSVVSAVHQLCHCPVAASVADVTLVAVAKCKSADKKYQKFLVNQKTMNIFLLIY